MDEFLEGARIGIIPIDGPVAKIAVDALSAYGKDRGHPAQLNLADCLSCACARSGGMPLLYKGSDYGVKSDELAEARNGIHDLVNRTASGLFASKSNSFLGDAADLAHAETKTHQFRAEAHDTGH